MSEPHPPVNAVQLGHVLRWDPSESGNKRWTCTVCGRAVLETYGNVYGSANERTCLALSL